MDEKDPSARATLARIDEVARDIDWNDPAIREAMDLIEWSSTPSGFGPDYDPILDCPRPPIGHYRAWWQESKP